MRKIKLFKTSPLYLEIFDYLSIKDKESLSYNDLYDNIMQFAFGWGDFWKTNLEKTGNFEVEEVFHNSELMQKKWAEAHKIKYDSANWLLDIIFTQIANNQPDVVFLHDYFFTPDFRKRIKKEIPCVKLILAWDGILFHNAKQFEGADIILAHVKDTLVYYAQHGFRTCEFSHGFEESLLPRLAISRKSIETSFVGSIMLFDGGHHERLHFLAELSRKISIDFFLSGEEVTKNFGLLAPNQLNRLKNKDFRTYLDIWQLGRKNKGAKFGIDMYQTLANSKITINKHIDLAKNNAANMRLFEATGTGTCLITDWKDNLSDYFIPNEEVVTYKTVSEAVSKIKFLLANDKEREKIALAGQKKTLKDFNFKNNFHRLGALIESLI